MNSMIKIKNGYPFDFSLALTLTTDNPRQSVANFNRTADHHCAIDQPCIFERLRHEKQRAQRSGSALSVLVVKQNRINGNSPAAIKGLLKAIQQKTRETDIAGYIDQRTLGVLLPYTNREGANKTREKLMAHYRDPEISITTSTYPDQLFNSLSKNGCFSPDAIKLMVENSIQNSRVQLWIKRAIDFVGSIVALLILSPLMLVVAVLVKCSSPGSVIFKQTRVGHKGIPFTFYKFRSMRMDADDQIHRDYVANYINGNHAAINNGDQDNPLYKIKSDPTGLPW